MSKIFIGIDNGVSGSIGIINGNDILFRKMPTKSQQNYTKAKANVTRIDVIAFQLLLDEKVLPHIIEEEHSVMALIERPMVNPTRFKATTSALRALEAAIIILEANYIPFDYIDSKEWQRVLLPKDAKGEELKSASVDIGSRLFPLHQQTIVKHKDADGLLIAEYCRRKFK